MKKLFSFLLLALPALLLAPAAPAQVPTFDHAIECGSGNGDWFGWGPQHLTNDAQGNAYVAGAFSGTVLLGSSILSAVQTPTGRLGPSDVFVAKLDAAGNYAWAIQFGDNQISFVSSLAVDALGDVYLSGGFDSYSLRLGAGGPQLFNSSARTEGYIAKFSGQTGRCLWARRCGSTVSDWLHTVRVNAIGEVYVLGIPSGSAVADYGPFTLNGSTDVLAKLSSTGTWLWARPVGTGSISTTMTLDGQGDIYLAGSFAPPSATLGSTTLTTRPVSNARSATDVFVAKVSDTGVWHWVVQGDGVGQQNLGGISSLALDSAGHVYVAGAYVGQSLQLGATRLPNQSILLPPPNGPAPPTPNTGNYFSDAFVARLSAATGAWEWAVRNGGSYNDFVSQLAVPNGQEIYVSGGFNSTVLGVKVPQMARLEASTGVWQQFARLDSMRVQAFAADRQGRVTLAGNFFQPALTLGPVRLAQAGPNQTTGFVARLGATPLPTRPTTTAGAGLEVWPNPTASHQVRVQGVAAGQIVEVLDVLGRQITSGRMPASGPLQLVLPASLPGGVYVVRGGGQARRLVVE